MKIKELLPLVKVHGRTLYDEDKKALFINWTNAGFTVALTGKYLKIKAVAMSDQIAGFPGKPTPPADWPCVGAVINDELTCRTELHNTEPEWVTLWEGEETQDIVIRVIKLSENARGKLGVLEVETDGEFKEYRDNRKVMEVVGDSITCGFGNEAPDRAFQFHTSEENGWATYGALAGRELGYDFSMICESGINAAKPEHPLWPMHAMEDIYEYTDELYDKKVGREPQKWDFEKNPVDIVVLNLGTNDNNPIKFYRNFDDIEPMEKWFHARYKEFVKLVRKCNGPDTMIICSLGSIDTYLYHHIKEVVAELKEETGDDKLYSFEYIPMNVMMEGSGAAGHPSAKTHVRMGKELANYIRKFQGE